MIVSRIIIRKYNWAVTVLFQCDCKDTDEVIDHLISIDCPYYLQKQAKQNLVQCNSNTGLTYSNFQLRRTIMVINKTDSTKELLNTITHECYHFVCQLNAANHIDNEEELAILSGDFNMNCWEIIRDIQE